MVMASTTASTMASLHDEQSNSEKGGSDALKPPPLPSDGETHVDAAAVDFPEGGLRAWSVVLGVWIAQFCTFGYTNAYGVYNDFYVREYLNGKYTSSQISWIGSAQLMLVLSIGLFSGRAFDTGYFYHLMIGGSLLLVFCMFMVSLSQAGQFYQIFLAQGLGVGTAVGITYVPSVSLLAHYFQRRRALAMGIAVSGSGVGGAVHPIMLNALFHGPVGFHNGVRASAGLLGGLLFIAILLMKPRLPPKSRKHGSTLSDLRVFLRDPPYVFMVLGTVLVFSGLYFPIFFLQLNAINNGISRNLAFYTLVVLNGASTVGRVLPNLLVARTGVFNVMIPCVLASSVLIFCFLALVNAAGTIVFAVLYGFFSGAYASLLSPMIASLAKKDSEIGARLGVCFFFTGFGGLVGTPVAGALLSKDFIWWRPSLFAGICVLTGALCFAVTRMLAARNKGTGWL
ncbi:putative major facilitator superfamily protein [Lyophyllum shimeji]|uniref:Major facilitator superfamily protein n=1 Tax=Lyophyllum shimeji TaxID=47721 RepID=A0A9P3PQS6_LYOSH|nr:putative major facilitator superfamily protein [Lyophyllum shimeji]